MWPVANKTQLTVSYTSIDAADQFIQQNQGITARTQRMKQGIITFTFVVLIVL